MSTLEGARVVSPRPGNRLRTCLERAASNGAATVRERFSHRKADRFLTGAALKETSETRSNRSHSSLFGKCGTGFHPVIPLALPAGRRETHDKD